MEWPTENCGSIPLYGQNISLYPKRPDRLKDPTTLLPNAYLRIFTRG